MIQLEKPRLEGLKKNELEKEKFMKELDQKHQLEMKRIKT